MHVGLKGEFKKPQQVVREQLIQVVPSGNCGPDASGTRSLALFLSFFFFPFIPFFSFLISLAFTSVFFRSPLFSYFSSLSPSTSPHSLPFFLSSSSSPFSFLPSLPLTLSLSLSLFSLSLLYLSLYLSLFSFFLFLSLFSLFLYLSYSLTLLPPHSVTLLTILLLYFLSLSLTLSLFCPLFFSLGISTQLRVGICLVRQNGVRSEEGCCARLLSRVLDGIASSRLSATLKNALAFRVVELALLGGPHPCAGHMEDEVAVQVPFIDVKEEVVEAVADHASEARRESHGRAER